jgi:predicted MFS family arabinose efflux permease
MRARLYTRAEPRLWTRPFLLVCSTHLLAYSSYAAVNPTFAAYLETVTHSTSFLGVIFGVFTFAAMIARPVAGWLLDRTNRRIVQAVTVVALAVATLSFTWVAVIWAVILFRVLHGLAWGANSTATPTIAADVVPAERQAEGFAYFGIVPSIALVVMPPIGLWVAHRFGFGVQFVGSALLALLALVPLFILDETTSSSDSIGTLYAPAALPAAFLVALASVPLGAIETLMPLYAPTVGLGNAGLFFTIMGAAIVLARATLGRLPGSMPVLLSSSFVLQAGGLALLALKPRLFVIRNLPLGLLAGAALFGVGFALVFPLLQSVAVSAAGDEQNGSATATVLIGMDAGIGLGAIMFGVIADLAGFAIVYMGAALFSLSGVLVTVLQGSILMRAGAG